VRVVATLLRLEVHPRLTLPEPRWSSFGRKLFSEADASINVPSTLKCSSDTPTVLARQLDNLGEKQIGDLMPQKPALVLAVDRRIEYLLVPTAGRRASGTSGRSAIDH
jgi:hypothetical protein